MIIQQVECSDLTDKACQGLAYAFCYDTLLPTFIYDTLCTPGMQVLFLAHSSHPLNMSVYESLCMPLLKHEKIHDDEYSFKWIVCHDCQSRVKKITHRLRPDEAKM